LDIKVSRFKFVRLPTDIRYGGNGGIAVSCCHLASYITSSHPTPVSNKIQINE
jgi:hypothetical protein